MPSIVELVRTERATLRVVILPYPKSRYLHERYQQDETTLWSTKIIYLNHPAMATIPIAQISRKIHGVLMYPHGHSYTKLSFDSYYRHDLKHVHSDMSPKAHSLYFPHYLTSKTIFPFEKTNIRKKILIFAIQNCVARTTAIEKLPSEGYWHNTQSTCLIAYQAHCPKHYDSVLCKSTFFCKNQVSTITQ